jgi:hypothetical protein
MNLLLVISSDPIAFSPSSLEFLPFIGVAAKDLHPMSLRSGAKPAASSSIL